MMTNEISPFLTKPTSLREAMDLATMIANSSFCPSHMKNKPGDVLLALQMGSEVGLSYMQALQNIAVINGKPCLYGDGALAVAMSSNYYEYHKEWPEGSISDGTRTAYCLVKRKNADEYIKSFSMDDAKKAQLWGKAGPWSQYPDRMLQMRARAFAIRDQFADALRGISIREEVEDYVINDKKQNISDIKKKQIKDQNVEDAIIVTEENVVHEEPLTIEKAIDNVKNAITIVDLEVAFKKAYPIFKDMPEEREHLIVAKDVRKAEL